MAVRDPRYYLCSLACFSVVYVLLSTIFGWRFYLIAEAAVALYCLLMYLYTRKRYGR